jgi:hypothetical protein
MILTNWKLRVDAAVETEVKIWLNNEAEDRFDVQTGEFEVEVGFKNINDAFRFRLQFDDELLA